MKFGLLTKFCWTHKGSRNEREMLAHPKLVNTATMVNWGISLFFILALWPGVGTNDSFTQIGGIMSGRIDGTHSTTMTVIWGIAYDLSGQFGSMFAAILIITATAIHIFIVSFGSNKKTWIFLFFWIAPWVLNFVNVVWKDVLLGSLLLLASSLVVSNLSRPHKFKILLITLVLSIALGTRANAILAVLPFIGYLIWEFSRESHSKLRTLAFAVTIIPITVAPSVLLGTAFEATAGHGADQPMVDDLAVISIARGESFVPQRDLEEVLQCQDSEYFGLPRNGFIRCLDGYNFGEDGLRIPTSLWLATVAGNLDVYLPHAIDKYWTFLWHDGTPYYYLRPFTATSNKELPDEIGWNFQQNTTSYAKDEWVEYWATYLPFLFVPLFWLITSLVIFISSVRRKVTPLSITLVALSSSSVLYLLGYAIFNHAADFRYALWPTWAVTISGLIVIVQALESKLRVAQ